MRDPEFAPPDFVPLPERHAPDGSSEDAARAFYDVMRKRRSVRMFSDRTVPLETVEYLVRTAASAPSGANKQPWRFVCVRDPAPWLIVVFRLTRDDDGGQVYYSTESVGLACGFLLAAAHHAGLATLTHTPSPMGFLAEILGRPPNERPFLLIPVGYPAEDCLVPARALERKALSRVLVLDRG